MLRNTLIRFLSLLSVAVLLLSLVACDTKPVVSDPDNSDVSSAPTDSEEQTTVDTTEDTTEGTDNTTVGTEEGADTTTADSTDADTTTDAAPDSTTTTGSVASNGNGITGSYPTKTLVTIKGNAISSVTTSDSLATNPSSSTGSPATPTTTSPSSDKENPDKTPTNNGLISKYVPNADLWRMKGFIGYEDMDFVYLIQILGKKQYDRGMLSQTIVNEKLGNSASLFYASLYTSEWPNHCNYGESLNGNEPADRTQAANNVVAWLKSQMATQTTGPYSSMDSFTRYEHYAAEAGYDYIGCEIGANVNAPQLSVAFARGAAKQYSEAAGLGSVNAWYSYFSMWSWKGMINYTGDETMHRHEDSFHNDVVNHENAGQSISAARRTYYMSYMAGARWMTNEGGAETACYPELNESGKSYKLSPHGEMNKEFFDFTQRNPDRGVTVVPFGIVIPRDHGLPYGHWMANDGDYKVFERFVFTDGDWMIDNLFRLLYPDNYPYQSVKDDSKQQVNTPYGDTVDIITDRAEQVVLNSYPVIILAGDVDLTPVARIKYTEYVQQGGTLVLNSAYTKDFPAAYRKTGTVGEGKVYVYGGDYKVDGLGAILDTLLEEHIPFAIDETIEYIVNVTDDSLILTLINNEGVFKTYDSAEVVDKSKTKTVNVKYTGSEEVTEVCDWMTGEKLKTSKEQTITVAPGDIAVIEFVL
ncbi:MAG: hypothetical protein IJO76_00775 [Clostridia bacterium]|nr:hypothetical protein [Clostridia bacterium]